MAAGSRRGRRTGRGAALVAAGGLVISAGVLVGCSGTGPTGTAGAPTGSGSGIGSWPTFLPSPTQQGTPTGSLGSPAMSYPGSPVIVRVGTAQALMDVEGPSYPSDTKVGAEEVRCTFRVTISGVTVPISMKAATIDRRDRSDCASASAHAWHRRPKDLAPEMSS